LPQAHTNVFIIRAYNEATRIGQVLQELIESKAGAIIVIDDGSSDATRAIVESFEIPCFSHPQNRG
jgi:glycosyltransferase involved in cell wall biosynthesis